MLSYNSHPEALELLEKHPDQMSYYGLSKNTNPMAVKLLKQLLDSDSNSNIDWFFVSGSPHIFEVDCRMIFKRAHPEDEDEEVEEEV